VSAVETEQYEKTLAKVRAAWIGREDHGILTIGIDFDYGSSGQGLPGVALDAWDSDKKRRVGDARSIDYINAILDAFGVDRFDKIQGRTIYALRDPGWNGLIRGLEPLPTEKGARIILSDIWRDEE